MNSFMTLPLVLYLFCFLFDFGHPYTLPSGPNGPAAKNGDKYSKKDNSVIHRSAFTAVKTKSQTGNVGDVITFDETPTNIDNDFSLESSIFTCQVPGVYVFMYSINVFQSEDPVLQLVKNGDLVDAVHARTLGSNDHDQPSNFAILSLKKEDKVWLQFAYFNSREVYGSEQKYTSFSGFLLYEN